MINYTGYVYIWYDTKAKLFYVGGHKGKVEDTYTCSNKMMKHAFKLRPNTCKFKVLQYINGSNKDIRKAEQYWLNLIKDEELYWTKNIYNNTVRYYNMKKLSSGGNGSANKGNSNIGGHNKSKPMSEEQKLKIKLALTGKKQSKEHIENRLKSINNKKSTIF